MMSRLSMVAGLVLGCTVLSGAASAQIFTAMSLGNGVSGNQQYGSTLGTDFVVNQSIFVTSLGAFDEAGHTLNGTISTTIYNNATQLAVPGLSAQFTAASPGTLEGSYLFKTVGGQSGVTLSPGSYVVTWTSLTNNDREGNSGVGGFTSPLFNNGTGNPITINTTQSRFNEQIPAAFGQDKYPVGTFGGVLDAGSFKFSKTPLVAATPEPGTLSLFAGLGVMGGSALLRRRRLRK